jgi:hypothetical protein
VANSRAPFTLLPLNNISFGIKKCWLSVSISSFGIFSASKSTILKWVNCIQTVRTPSIDLVRIVIVSRPDVNDRPTDEFPQNVRSSAIHAQMFFARCQKKDWSKVGRFLPRIS